MDIIDKSIEAVKRLAELAEKNKYADVHEVVAALRLDLAKAKTDIADLMDEKRILLEHIRELEQRNDEAVGMKLSVDGKAYYRVPPVEGEYNGPFCKRCRNPLDRDNYFPTRHRCSFCGHAVLIQQGR